jgi:hypothetical protein
MITFEREVVPPHTWACTCLETKFTLTLRGSSNPPMCRLPIRAAGLARWRSPLATRVRTC